MGEPELKTIKSAPLKDAHFLAMHSRCRQNCDYCPGFSALTAKDKSEGDLLDELLLAQAHGFEQVKFACNLLDHPDLPSWIQTCHDHGFEVCLQVQAAQLENPEAVLQLKSQIHRVTVLEYIFDTCSEREIKAATLLAQQKATRYVTVPRRGQTFDEQVGRLPYYVIENLFPSFPKKTLTHDPFFPAQEIYLQMMRAREHFRDLPDSSSVVARHLRLHEYQTPEFRRKSYVTHEMSAECTWSLIGWMPGDAPVDWTAWEPTLSSMPMGSEFLFLVPENRLSDEAIQELTTRFTHLSSIQVFEVQGASAPETENYSDLIACSAFLSSGKNLCFLEGSIGFDQNALPWVANTISPGTIWSASDSEQPGPFSLKHFALDRDLYLKLRPFSYGPLSHSQILTNQRIRSGAIPVCSVPVTQCSPLTLVPNTESIQATYHLSLIPEIFEDNSLSFTQNQSVVAWVMRLFTPLLWLLQRTPLRGVVALLAIGAKATGRILNPIFQRWVGAIAWMDANAWRFWHVLAKPFRWLKLNLWRSQIPWHLLRSQLWKLAIPYYFLHRHLWRLTTPFHFIKRHLWKLAIPVHKIRAHLWRLAVPFQILRGQLWRLAVPFQILRGQLWRLAVPFQILRGQLWRLVVPFQILRGQLWRLVVPFQILRGQLWRFVVPFQILRGQLWRFVVPFQILRGQLWRLAVPIDILRGQIWRLVIPLSHLRNFVWRLGVPFRFLLGQLWRLKTPYHLFCAHAWKVRVLLIRAFDRILFPVRWLFGNLWRLKIPYYLIKHHGWRVVLPYHFAKKNWWLPLYPLFVLAAYVKDIFKYSERIHSLPFPQRWFMMIFSSVRKTAWYLIKKPLIALGLGSHAISDRHHSDSM